MLARTLSFWGALIVLLAWRLVLRDPQEPELALRAIVFLVTGWLLFSEWKRLNRFLVTAGDALRQRALKVPARPELGFFGCLLAAPLLAGWIFALWAFSPTLRRLGQPEDNVLALSIVAAIAWAAISVQWLALFLGGMTNFRHRLALLKLPHQVRPRGRVIPWTVAAWSTPFLLLALCGLPSADTTVDLVEAAAGGGGGDRVELLLELGPDDHFGEVAAVVQGVGATAEPLAPGFGDDDLSQTWVLSVQEDQALLLAILLALDSENVDAIQLNAAVAAGPLPVSGACSSGQGGLLSVDDPLASGQAELRQLGADRLLAELQGRTPRRPAVVAVIDTGVDADHEDLRRVVATRTSQDGRGHGTAVASAVAAVTDNHTGMASLNEGGRFVHVRAYPALASPSAGADDVARAILQAVHDGVDVINLSFGAVGQAPAAVQHAVRYAIGQRVIIVAAAGNDGANAASQWPANIDGVIVVGSVDHLGQRAGHSNFSLGGRAVSAPGVDVCVATPEGGYMLSDGTSVAAGAVSGLLAVLRAECPSLSPEDAAVLLHLTGQPMPAWSGLGPLVQADRAWAELGRWCW